MTRFLSPIRPSKNGTYRVRLDPSIRALLASVPEQLLPLLGSDDPTLRRLRPPAYVGDEHAAEEQEYQDLVGRSIDVYRRQALQTLADTAQATTLSSEQLHGWLAAIETIRLVLGTRLDVQEDMALPGRDDPQAAEHTLYHLLSFLQEAIVDVLVAELPDEGTEGVEGAGRAS